MANKKRGICYICRKRTEIIDEHHIVPQFAGGERGPTVDLCSKCHSGIHRQALNIMGKGKKKAFFTNPAEMERAAPLVKFLIIARTRVMESREARPMQLVLDVDSEFMLVLHMLKVDAGHTNLSVFAASILRQYARSKL